MAKGRGKKIAGIPKNALIVGLVVVAAFVGFYVYRKKSLRQTMRARAFQRAMLARRRM